MARPSSIDKLPDEVRELIGDLRRQGRTIDEILAKLKELGAGVSRAALGRHTKEIDAIMEEIQRSRGISQAIIDRMGDEPDSRTARLNVELMHSLMTRCLMGDGAGPIELDPKEAMFLASALDKLSSAASKDVDRVTKLEQRAAQKAREAAAKVAFDAVKTSGGDEEHAAYVRAEILGVRVEGDGQG